MAYGKNCLNFLAHRKYSAMEDVEYLSYKMFNHLLLSAEFWLSVVKFLYSGLNSQMAIAQCPNFVKCTTLYSLWIDKFVCSSIPTYLANINPFNLERMHIVLCKLVPKLSHTSKLSHTCLHVVPSGAQVFYMQLQSGARAKWSPSFPSGAKVASI